MGKKLSPSSTEHVGCVDVGIPFGALCAFDTPDEGSLFLLSSFPADPR